MPLPLISASDGFGRIDLERHANGDQAGQHADHQHGEEPRYGVGRHQQHVLGENRRGKGGGDLAHHKADHAQCQRLLHDHCGDGAVARSDQLQHRDLADLVHGQRVDDERDDRGADDGQDHQEHADLLGRGGDQLADQNAFHLRARVDGQRFQRRMDSATSSGA
jgi:hypothetical protein